VTQRQLENHPETLPDGPGRNINLGKIPAKLARKSVISGKKINP